MKILIDEATVKLALEALELAQDNLRDHGDNCFLNDEGEYNRCFCGKDSLFNHLQFCVEELDQAIEQAQKQQEPICVAFIRTYVGKDQDGIEIWKDEPLYLTPPQRQPLTDEQCDEVIRRCGLWTLACTVPQNLAMLRGLCREAAHGIKGEA